MTRSLRRSIPDPGDQLPRIIGAYNRSAAPDDSLVLTGANFTAYYRQAAGIDTEFTIYARRAAATASGGCHY